MAGILGWRLRQTLSGHHLKAEKQVTTPMRRIGVGLVSGGWALPACTIYLLVLCLRFNLNVGYLLVFSLAILMISAAYVGAKQLRRIRLSMAEVAPVALGSPSILRVALLAPTPRANVEVLCLADGQSAFHTIQLSPHVETVCQLAVAFTRRGVHPMPEVTVQTRYPLGVWRMFVRWQPPVTCVVHPLPERRPPPIPGTGDAARGKGIAQHAHGDGELSGLRPYQAGESLRQIAWRTFAKTDGQVLASRQRDQQDSPENCVLRWEDAAPAGDLEQTLSRLTAWVLAAHQQGSPYSLSIGETTLRGQGQGHLHECLAWLARHSSTGWSP